MYILNKSALIVLDTFDLREQVSSMAPGHRCIQSEALSRYKTYTHTHTHAHTHAHTHEQSQSTMLFMVPYCILSVLEMEKAAC
jgi:hypothetical protein